MRFVLRDGGGGGGGGSGGRMGGGGGNGVAYGREISWDDPLIQCNYMAPGFSRTKSCGMII